MVKSFSHWLEQNDIQENILGVIDSMEKGIWRQMQPLRVRQEVDMILDYLSRSGNNSFGDPHYLHALLTVNDLRKQWRQDPRLAMTLGSQLAMLDAICDNEVPKIGKPAG